MTFKITLLGVTITIYILPINESGFYFVFNIKQN